MEVGWTTHFLDAGFGVAGADHEEAFAVWREQCDRSRAIVAASPSLDVRAREPTTTDKLMLSK
jgi:hypothetical protein